MGRIFQKNEKSVISWMKKEASLRTVVESASDPVFVVDLENHRIMYANKKAVRLTRFSLAELIGKDSLDFLKPKEYSRILDIYHQEIEKGFFPKQFKAAFFDKNRKEIIVDVSVTRVKWNGKPASFALVRDISKQNETEKNLEEEKIKLEVLIDNLPSLVWFKDKNSRYIKVNKEFARVAGVTSSEDIVGKTTSEIWPPKLAKRYMLEDKKVFKSKKVIETEETAIKVNGEKIYFESTKGPIRSKNGETLGTFGITHDITRFRLAEEALRESEEKFRMVIEDLPMLICRFLPGGTIAFVNKNYCEYFKKTEEELIGTSFLNLIPKKERKYIKERFSSLTPENPSITYEHQVNAPSGLRWQRWIDRAIFNPDGTIKAYQSIGEDITDDKEMHSRLLESYKYLGTVNRQMSVLLDLSRLSHSTEKNKKKIADYIAWSALELSNSDFVIMYKFDKRRKVFYLMSLASHLRIEEKEKSKITSISMKSNKTLQFILKDNTAKIRQCFENTNLRKFSEKYKMNHCCVLPLIYRKKIEGIIIMGFLSKREMSDQEKGFYQVFSMYTSYLFSNNNFLR